MINPKSKIGYSNRGLANYNIKNYIESIKDFTSAIEIDSNDSKSYLYRGSANLLLKKSKEACLDLEKAKKLGEKTVIEIINKYCK